MNMSVRMMVLLRKAAMGARIMMVLMMNLDFSPTVCVCVCLFDWLVRVLVLLYLIEREGRQALLVCTYV